MADIPAHITVNPEGPPPEGSLTVVRAGGTVEHHDITVEPDTTPVKVRWLAVHEDEDGVHNPGDESSVIRHTANQLVWLHIAEEV